MQCLNRKKNYTKSIDAFNIKVVVIFFNGGLSEKKIAIAISQKFIASMLMFNRLSKKVVLSFATLEENASLIKF